MSQIGKTENCTSAKKKKKVLTQMKKDNNLKIK